MACSVHSQGEKVKSKSSDAEMMYLRSVGMALAVFVNLKQQGGSGIR